MDDRLSRIFSGEIPTTTFYHLKEHGEAPIPGVYIKEHGLLRLPITSQDLSPATDAREHAWQDKLKQDKLVWLDSDLIVCKNNRWADFIRSTLSQTLKHLNIDGKVSLANERLLLSRNDEQVPFLLMSGTVKSILQRSWSSYLLTVVNGSFQFAVTNGRWPEQYQQTTCS